MTDTVVAEGQVKFRDGKKWKTRWVVLRKPSPVADCLSLLVYKEKKREKEKGRGHKERLNVTLEGICGVEPGPGYDGVAYTLSILCLGQPGLSLGFHSRDALLAWDARIRYSLGEVHRFSVNVQPGTKLESGPASLHLCNNLLVLTRDNPPTVTGHWKLSELRRYGAVPSGFVFEGGTRCGYWAGVFFLSCSEGEQISFLFDCIVRGISPSRAPHGLRPAMPVDPSANPSSSEERINLEASELERRLSMLSHCSRPISTASTYSCSTIAVDDQSSISSSSSSQSDASFGSRVPVWSESTSRPHLSTETVSSSSTLMGLANSEDRLYAAVMGSSVIRPSSKQLHPRGLHDSGRQSSLDSGIGIVTGSQSSYSGSFSSYTGSLDTTSQGGGEEFGSLASLPVPPPPPPPPPPPCTPPPLSIVIPEYNSSCPSRPDSSASHRHSEEYQIPSLLRLCYDTPRSLFQSLSPRDPVAQGGPPETGKDRRSSGDGGQRQGLSDRPTEPCLQRAGGQHQATMQRSRSWGSERPPSVDSAGTCRPRPSLLAGCPVCLGTQCSHGSDNYITPEQWRSARSRGLMQDANCSSSAQLPAADTPDTSLGVREERVDVVGSVLADPERSEPPPPPSGPRAPPKAPSFHTQTPLSGAFQSPRDAPAPLSLDTRLHADAAVNYVNIPISPVVAKAGRELLYMELDLLEPRTAAGSCPPNAVREEDSIRYAHLDIAAMETAQRVGAEHAQGREDRLTQLESRRRPH